mgnify:CR=1 FL=1
MKKKYVLLLLIVCTFTCIQYGYGYSDTSLYQISALLEEQNGKKIPFEHFSKKPVIISMFYSSCQYSCPLLIQNIKSIENKMSKQARKHIQFLLVSFDPERDNQQKLKEIMKKHHLSESHWTLARTSHDKIREIANVLGFSYRKLDNGDYNHSFIISLLNKEGELVIQSEGLKNSTAFIKKIHEMN